MPLTRSCDPGTESRQAGTTAVQAVAIGSLSHIRTSVDELVLEQAGATGPQIDIVDEWGMQSFPASDPPTNW